MVIQNLRVEAPENEERLRNTPSLIADQLDWLGRWSATARTTEAIVRTRSSVALVNDAVDLIRSAVELGSLDCYSYGAMIRICDQQHLSCRDARRVARHLTTVKPPWIEHYDTTVKDEVRQITAVKLLEACADSGNRHRPVLQRLRSDRPLDQAPRKDRGPEASERINDDGRSIGYIKRVEKNTFIDLMRKSTRRPTSELTDLVRPSVDEEPRSVEELAEGDEEVRTARRILDELVASGSVNQGKVDRFFAHAGLGVTAPELAVAAGVKNAAMRKELSRVRSKVRAELTASGV